MHDTTTVLMRALAIKIDQGAEFADELGEASARAEAGGQASEANAFAAQAHIHRVQIMDWRVNLGMLVGWYGALHLDPPV